MASKETPFPISLFKTSKKDIHILLSFTKHINYFFFSIAIVISTLKSFVDECGAVNTWNADELAAVWLGLEILPCLI